MAPRGDCVHVSPGRLRIRVPERRGDAAFFGRAREILAVCPGVEQITVNAATGSILLRHCADLPDIAALAAEHGIFSLAEAGRKKRRFYPAVVGAYRTADERISRLSGGEIDLPGAATLTLAAAGIYQISKGRFGAPAWYTAFWYALNIFLKAKARPEGK